MNALLYAANTQAQALTTTDNINFGVPVRRYGKNINISGGNVVVDGEGYYAVDVTVTFIPGAAGTATLQLYENGVAISGADASRTVAADAIYALTVPTAFKIRCCEEKVITASIIGVDTNVTNAAVRVVKA